MWRGICVDCGDDQLCVADIEDAMFHTANLSSFPTNAGQNFSTLISLLPRVTCICGLHFHMVIGSVGPSTA